MLRLHRLPTLALFGPLALQVAISASLVLAQAAPPRAVYPASPGAPTAPPPPPPASPPPASPLPAVAPSLAAPPAPPPPPPPPTDRRSLREAEHAQRVQERDAERARRIAAEEAHRDARASEKAAIHEARAAQRAAAVEAREAEHARRAAIGAAAYDARLRAHDARLDEREAARAEKLERRAARDAEQAVVRARWEEHRALHRVSFGVAFAPAIMVRKLPERGSNERADVGAVRQRTVEFGLAYLHDFTPNIGLRAGAAWGVGVTHFDLDLHGDDCCGDGSRKLDPSYSLSFEVAPTFSARRFGLYGSTGLALRMFFLPEQRASVSADSFDNRDDYVETVSRRVSFKSPTVALAARLGLGYRFGRNHEYDLGLGFDVGPAFREASVYTSMFFRFSVAFTDIALGD